MKKILFFIENLAGGGAEKVLSDLITNLDKTKYEITLCSLIDIGVYNKQISKVCHYTSILPNPNELSVYHKILYRIKYNLIRNLPPKWIYNYFFKEQYDVEIAFIEGYATKIIGSSSNSKSKKIAWVHIDLFANHWTKTEYSNIADEIKVYQNFNHIFCVAESVKLAFTKKFGITDNLHVKYNPVDRKNILLKSKETLNFELNDDTFKLVTVGRLENQKGYDRLLEIVFKLKNDGFQFELWIIGEGSQRVELEDYIKSHNIEAHVKLLGFQKNPYKFISKSDAFICSSRSEGYSTVVTEALILGKPVVATNCSGMTELLRDNEYGLITKNNTEDLYAELKHFLEDKELQLHYTNKSEERSKDFDIRKTIQNIEQQL
ncbi:glycosyltransferase [Algibacter sp.]|nr:glycosyltransferase [Algibacter sp.]